MPQFRDSFYALVPPWLTQGNAERYLYTLELMRDLLCEKAFQAQTIRLPGQGDLSQVPYLAFDRQLIQGPLESDAAFIVRLQNAFETWNHAGSAIAVLGQLQTYAQGRQSIDATQFAIVSNQRTLESGDRVNTWWTIDYDDPIGTQALLSTVPHNFDWDGNSLATWRTWLIVYQYLDPPNPLFGVAGQITSAGGGSFILSDLGHNVGGVWVPKTSGTPVNAPFLTMTGLTGMTADNIGDILAVSGSVNPDNNGQFQIADVLSSSSVVIVNPRGVSPDVGPLTWQIQSYPWISPGPAWGTPNTVWGQGQETPPPIDTGGTVRGVWKPSTLGSPGQHPTFSWGLNVDSLEIETIRGLVKTWKSAGTYYPNIIICFDGATEFSRLFGEGTGNPDGTFGSVGALITGVWVPTRFINSVWDCYCQGTGVANACSQENIT